MFYVNLQNICKFFIEWDEDMIDKRNPDVQYGARVNVSTVVEELGKSNIFYLIRPEH